MEKKKIIIISGVSLALIVLLSIIIIKMNTTNKTKTNNTNTQNNQQEIQEQNQNEEPAKEEQENTSSPTKCTYQNIHGTYGWSRNPLMTKEYNRNGMPKYDSNGPITEEKLKEIIDNQLSFLFYKNNFDEITNEDLFSKAHAYLNYNGKDSKFTAAELEDALSKTVLGYMQLIHESHYYPSGYDYIYDNGIYTRDEESYVHADIIFEEPVFGKVISFTEADGQYTISAKYLWVAGHYKPGNEVYRTRQDAINENNKITIEGTPCLVDWAYENFDIYKSELDTYNFVFEEVDNHINLIDFYIN